MNNGLSIVIPVYEAFGRGEEFLSYNFSILKQQDYQNFQIVVSDDSLDDKIRLLCASEKDLDIKYVKNEGKRGSSSNTNNAIRNCPINSSIKVLCMDDYLLGSDALTLTLKALEDNMWLATSYFHTKDRQLYFKYHLPQISQMPFLINLIGTHSCLTFYNDGKTFFDENLVNHLDCDFEYSLLTKYGLPVILREATVAQFLWSGQMSNTLVNDELDQKEIKYLLQKYGVK